MSEHTPHPTDALQEAVDGRLDAAARAELDRHLVLCPACRRELDALTWVKRQVGYHDRAASVPLDLPARILRALDAEDGDTESAGSPRSSDRRGVPGRWWIGGLAGAAAVVAVVWIGTRPGSPTVPAQVAETFREYLVGGLSRLELRTSDPAALEAQLRTAGLSFSIRVFDFGMMDYRLTGGGVHEVAGRSSAMFAYDGPSALRVLCQMYEATLEDLPPPVEQRSNDGIEFFVYREGDVTIVFWQEGSVVCVLAANGNPEAAIRLAFAKAVRV